jgi:hypothetical protein
MGEKCLRDLFSVILKRLLIINLALVERFTELISCTRSVYFAINATEGNDRDDPRKKFEFNGN